MHTEGLETVGNVFRIVTNHQQPTERNVGKNTLRKKKKASKNPDTWNC